MSLIKKAIYQWLDKQFMDGCSNYNSLDVRKSSRSKKQARAVFLKQGVPHAKGLIFFNPMKAISFAKEHGFPLVIKPNISGFSRGSHFPITNFKELWTAIFLAKFWWPTTVVEQYLDGKNYRIVVSQGNVMSVIERFAPFVQGDGVNTIQTLIDIENTTRKNMKLYPCMSPLSKGLATKRFLLKSNRNLETIPSKGEVVYLFNRISLAPGGVVEIIDKKNIPEINNEIFKKILSAFNANILGIDVIFEQSIMQSYLDQKCIFLEVNSRPFLKMHDFPRYGEKEDLSKYFAALDALIVTQKDVF